MIIIQIRSCFHHFERDIPILYFLLKLYVQLWIISPTTRFVESSQFIIIIAIIVIHNNKLSDVLNPNNFPSPAGQNLPLVITFSAQEIHNRINTCVLSFSCLFWVPSLGYSTRNSEEEQNEDNSRKDILNIGRVMLPIVLLFWVFMAGQAKEVLFILWICKCKQMMITDCWYWCRRL